METNIKTKLLANKREMKAPRDQRELSRKTGIREDRISEIINSIAPEPSKLEKMSIARALRSKVDEVFIDEKAAS